MEDDSASAVAYDAGDPGTDHLIAQYFGEVRRFALLSFVREQALGRPDQTLAAARPLGSVHLADGLADVAQGLAAD